MDPVRTYPTIDRLDKDEAVFRWTQADANPLNAAWMEVTMDRASFDQMGRPRQLVVTVAGVVTS